MMMFVLIFRERIFSALKRVVFGFCESLEKRYAKQFIISCFLRSYDSKSMFFRILVVFRKKFIKNHLETYQSILTEYWY